MVLIPGSGCEESLKGSPRAHAWRQSSSRRKGSKSIALPKPNDAEDESLLLCACNFYKAQSASQNTVSLAT